MGNKNVQCFSYCSHIDYAIWKTAVKLYDHTNYSNQSTKLLRKDNYYYDCKKKIKLYEKYYLWNKSCVAYKVFLRLKVNQTIIDYKIEKGSNYQIEFIRQWQPYGSSFQRYNIYVKSVGLLEIEKINCLKLFNQKTNKTKLIIGKQLITGLIIIKMVEILVDELICCFIMIRVVVVECLSPVLNEIDRISIEFFRFLFLGKWLKVFFKNRELEGLVFLLSYLAFCFYNHLNAIAFLFSNLIKKIIFKKVYWSNFVKFGNF